MNLSQLNRLLLQTLLIPVVALLFVAALLALQILRAQQTVARMQQADSNIAVANLVYALTVDEETGLRGFQVTGNEIFLQPFYFAQKGVDSSLRELRQGLVQQGEDPTPVDDFVRIHATWRASFAEPLIAVTSAGGDTRDSGLNLRGKAQMDALRSRITRITDTEKAHRTRIFDLWEAQTRNTLIALGVLSITIGLGIGIFARNRLHGVSEVFQATLESLRRNALATYESEQRLRTTLTSIGDGVIVCDVAGRIELLNPLAEQLTGWTEKEAFHQSLERVFHVVHETTREPIRTPVAAVNLSKPTAPTHHALLLRRNGTELHIDDSGAPILDRSGRLAGIVIVFRDVTEQRRAQAALLATEKLAVAGRLAATLAHEIHNPLDAVSNLLYLMQSSPTPEESAQFLDLASQELARVTQISRAMLGMYRESRFPVAVDVQEMLESILLLLNRQMVRSELTVHTHFAQGATVAGYPAELRQVFINLLTNALAASPQGSSLEVRTELRPASRSNNNRAGVAIIIADQGQGIPAENLPLVFQPFFTTKGEQGTGLGLWVSQGIVDKHDGSIHIASRTAPHDHGTTITVFLPRESPIPTTGT